MKKTVKVLTIALCFTVLSLSTLLFASCKCEHEWSEWQIVTAATCESEGVESRKCSKCDNTEIKKIDALGHEEVTDEEIAATCTTTGKTEGKHCSRCRKVLVQQQDIPALGHDFVDYIYNNDATCVENGTKTAKCSRCPKTDTITAENTALGHEEVTDAAVEPTCTKTGLTEGKHCSRCNEILVQQEIVKALGHEEVTDAAVEPTCTKTGLTAGKHCGRCNEVLVKQEIVKALGHEDVTDAAVEATCTKTGLTEGKHCSRCNEILVKQEIVNALGHNWKQWETLIDATCTANGVKTRQCTRCENNEIDKIVALGHLEVIDKAVEATCTKTGLTEGKHCARCSEVFVKQEIVNALGHNFTNYTYNNDATCLENGTKTAKCSRCPENDTITAENTALGHLEVIDKAVAATCTKTGLTEGKHCSRCSKVLVKQTTVNALGHFYKNGICENCSDDISTKGMIYVDGETIGTCILQSIGTAKDKDIIIPGKYKGRTVTEISENAFKYQQIESITIPDTIKKIGNNAFIGCNKLKAVYITNLAAWCTTSFFNYSSNPLEYAKKLYLNNSLISELYIPKDIEIISNWAFAQCVSITKVSIGNNVKKIGKGAFSACINLQSVIVSENIIEIDDCAFQFCRNLLNIHIGSTVERIGNRAFYNCSKLLKNIDGALYVDGWIVGADENIQVANIVGYSVGIADMAFYNCKELTKVIIGSKVSIIGKNAFLNCNNIECIEVSDLNLTYKSVDGNLYSRDGKVLIKYSAGNKMTTLLIPDGVTIVGESAVQNAIYLSNIIIPHGVLNIEYNAFVGCINLIDINLPEGLEKIGDYAFCGCEKLNVVTIPNETISIGEYAFADCTNVSQINIGISVNKIGSYAFASCKSLTSIYIPNSVIEIERYAFWNCQNLERIDVSAENENYRSVAGDLYEKKGEKLVQYAIGKKEESISLPDGIRTIGEYAFSCCVYIKSITIFDEMIYVEIGAFSGCTNLSEVNYKGTEEQWNKISIEVGNDYLLKAKRNYI